MTSEAFVVSPRAGGVIEMVVRGPWSEEAREAVVAERVESLVLNYALGFGEPDVEFLEGLPVRRLTLVCRWLKSLDAVEGLPLESLSLVTDPKLTIDLGRFPALTELSVDWPQVKATIGTARRLEHLYLGRYSEVNLSPLANSAGLTSLVLKDRPRLESLDGLAAFPALVQLGVYRAQKLVDIEGLRAARQLRELQLETCRKISRLDEIADLRELEFLNVSNCGDLPTAEPLRGLDKLQTLFLYESTRILDGDLSPVAALPRLRELRMQERRGYVPTVSEIQQSLVGPQGR